MPFFTSSIIGSGTRQDPYRPLISQYVSYYSAHIPSLGNGKPKFTDCIVFVKEIPVSLPPTIKILTDEQAINTIKSRDPEAEPDKLQ